MTRLRLPKGWFYPLAGGLLGLAYVILDEGILDQIASPSSAVAISHEFVDAILPVLLGMSMGVTIGFFRRQLRINRSLSLKKDKLERELLLSTLISQMLHEIQNPIHNISAAFENAEGFADAEKQSVIRKNLERLSELKKKYGGWDWPARLDPEEPFHFKPWFKDWVEDKLGFQLRALDIQYAEEIENLRISVHPVVMEQILQTIFENALEAVEKSGDKRTLRVEAKTVPDGRVRIRIGNSGTPFPPDVLQAQGTRPASSRHGLGLGLLLLNKILEQVDGKMSLSSEPPGAVVTLEMPGESA